MLKSLMYYIIVLVLQRSGRSQHNDPNAANGIKIVGRVAKFISAIDLETGDFEVDASEIAACDRLEARDPDAQIL